jgi:hypothetical protein
MEFTKASSGLVSTLHRHYNGQAPTRILLSRVASKNHHTKHLTPNNHQPKSNQDEDGQAFLHVVVEMA